MKRIRRSIIWTTPKNEFELIVKESKTITEILSKFGFQNKGSNFKTLKQRMVEEGINYEHLKEYRKYIIIKNSPNLEDVMTENSMYSRKSLKRRLIKEKLLENRCNDCGIPAVWNNKPLSLEIDHKNGISNDNRLINLQLLCPNCHSQTINYSGKANAG